MFHLIKVSDISLPQWKTKFSKNKRFPEESQRRGTSNLRENYFSEEEKNLLPFTPSGNGTHQSFIFCGINVFIVPVNLPETLTFFTKLRKLLDTLVPFLSWNLAGNFFIVFSCLWRRVRDICFWIQLSVIFLGTQKVKLLQMQYFV